MLQQLNHHSIAIHQEIRVYFYVSKAGIERNKVRLDTIQEVELDFWLHNFCSHILQMLCMYICGSIYIHIWAKNFIFFLILYPIEILVHTYFLYFSCFFCYNPFHEYNKKKNRINLEPAIQTKTIHLYP